MKKFNFSFKFLDRFKKSKDTTPEEDNIEVESDNYSDEDPEDFAEKTLGNFNLQKFHEQHANDDVDENDSTNPGVVYQEMSPPEKPEEAKRFKIKFPRFNKETGQNLKDRFSNTSAMKSMDKVSWNDFFSLQSWKDSWTFRDPARYHFYLSSRERNRSFHWAYYSDGGRSKKQYPDPC
jgi:hypothetical protein